MRALNLFLALLQCLVPYVLSRLGLDLSMGPQPPIVPAGYAFSIWGLIYLANVLFALYALSRRDPLFDRLLPLTAQAYLGTCLWLVLAWQELHWLSVACMLWLLAVTLRAHFAVVAERHRLRGRERALLETAISVFAGWISIATFANVATALARTGMPGAGPVGACVMLVVAAALASAVILASRGNVLYGCTLLWAFAGIVVANGLNPVGATAAAMAALVVGLLIWRGERYPAGSS